MKILKFIVLIIIAGFIFTSCDKVDCPACGKDSIGITDTIFKKVLLEEYTGFRCPNCPAAAATAHDLKNLFGERLVIISAHVGILAMPIGGNYNYDFRDSTGTAWDNFFGPSSIGLPKGMINRIGYPVQSSYILDAGDWGSKINGIILDSADANIEIHSTLNETTRELTVDLDAYFYADLTGTYYVNVCIIEDSIIKYQKDQILGDIPDYNHMHVLRGSVSNIWGDLLITDPAADSSSFHSLSFPKHTIDADRVLKNCSIVAFIYRQDNAGGGKYGQYEIVQAEQKKIK